MPDALLAAFHSPPEGPAVEIWRLFRHRPEQLWAALTIPERLAAWMGVEWLGPPDPLAVGSPLHYRFANTDIECRGQVLRLQAPALLEHSWFDNLPPPSVVRWSLAPEAGGTRLTLTQRFGAADDATRNATGWTQLLERLDAAAGGTEPPAGRMAEWRRLRDRYAAKFPPAATRDGRRVEVDGATALRFERRMRHGMEAVWSALVTPSILAGWLQAEALVDPHMGGRFHLVFQGGPHSMQGTILRWEPPHVLEYTWPEAEAHGDSVVRFELSPEGDGCILVLTHLLPAGRNLADFAAGWHWHLDALDTALEGQARTFDQPRWAALRQIYAATLMEPALA